ncbi:hypothetical protein [Edaphobacter modestus]|uniref:Uncharacterized protein n=1 Tax=Edaphobacter modestus TaxID=388466 RepID=A0A4Q7YVN4_9BACT|nr:hypothetical protein [Edaphobacter modestus]RZU41105.1 hypothetical protein BDD14_2601 [Edaphobacter modestus]
MDRHHSRARMIYSLRRLLRNDHPFGQPNCDRCVEFLTATQRIKDLSCGAHQWTSLPVTGIYVSNERRSRRFLIVGYSNPDGPTERPNNLCYCVPLLLDRSVPGGGFKLLACFAPESMVPLSKGLYLENKAVKEDALEDWFRFCGPLERCFWPHETGESPECQGDRSELDPEWERFARAGIFYKDSIDALVKLWSESKKEIQDELNN